MGKTELLGFLLLLPLLIFVPAGFKSRLSFLISCGFTAVTGNWAIQTFLTGNISVFLAELPLIGTVSANIDFLSAVFILIINLITTLASFYAIGYMDKYKEESHFLSLNFISFNLLHFSMVMICSVQNLLAFLFLWEIMSLSSFVLVLFYSDKRETIKAAINYLIQMQVGATFLLSAIVFLYSKTGLLTFQALGEYFSTHSNLYLFLIFFIGFGIKAGFVPLHTWLPHAHPAAPGHISAVMSGVMIKVGIYGILRIISLMQAGLSETGFIYIGCALLGLGIITGLYGIINSIMQKDLKKMLAYSSIENIGVIGIGIGMGMLGLGVKDHALSFLGFSGAILHVFNHAVFKSLLFFASGSVFQGTSSSNMEIFGGLLKKMPVTGIVFLVGSLAICALPPFNGFISEFILFNGMVEGLKATNVALEVMLLISLIALALIGGLAVFSFSRAFGLSFLGNPRTMNSEKAQEGNFFMILPQIILSTLVLVCGLFPQLIFRMISKSLSLYVPKISPYKLQSLEIMNELSIALIAFLIVFALVYFIRNYFVKKNKERHGSTWGCGYTAPNARMQYSPSSFSGYLNEYAKPLVGQSLSYTEIKPMEIFPKNRGLETKNEDVIEKKIIKKGIKFLNEQALQRVAVIQSGKLQAYNLYAFLFLIILFILTFLGVI